MSWIVQPWLVPSCISVIQRPLGHRLSSCAVRISHKASPPLPYISVHWDELPGTEYKGETGTAVWRTLINGDVRMRVVELSPDYLADHWCDHGHVVYVPEGEATSELADGRSLVMKPGIGYTVSDFDDAAHRSRTELSARMFIVD